LSELFRGGLVPLVWAPPAAQAKANASRELKGASGATPCAVVIEGRQRSRPDAPERNRVRQVIDVARGLAVWLLLDIG
jgi:hypothetical protein